MNWYLAVVKKYAVFSGRARRKEYWMFVLFNIIFSFVATLLDSVIGTTSDSGYGLLSVLYSLAVLLPTLAVGIRRLHDIGKSGWWLLITLIPLIGSIWLLVLFGQIRRKVFNQRWQTRNTNLQRYACSYSQQQAMEQLNAESQTRPDRAAFVIPTLTSLPYS
jgi:uncharacterized membrane protein YhaH (DUF805 family)